MKNYALLGKSLGHSISPYVHELLFELTQQQAQYTLCEVDSVAHAAESMLMYDGCNVTIPFKQGIMRHLKQIDSTAMSLGAVNTITKDGHGYNTDVVGLQVSLAQLCTGKRSAPLASNVKTAVVLGFGGMGQVCYHYLSRQGIEVTVAVRDVTKATASAVLLHRLSGRFDLLINATPVGMYPYYDDIAIDCARVDVKYALDTVYNPLQTWLLAALEKKGTVVQNGLCMLVEQAAQSHKLWYGAQFTARQKKQIVEKCRVHIQMLKKTKTNN